MSGGRPIWARVARPFDIAIAGARRGVHSAAVAAVFGRARFVALAELLVEAPVVAVHTPHQQQFLGSGAFVTLVTGPKAFALAFALVLLEFGAILTVEQWAGEAPVCRTPRRVAVAEAVVAVPTPVVEAVLVALHALCARNTAPGLGAVARTRVWVEPASVSTREPQQLILVTLALARRVVERRQRLRTQQH